MTDAQKRFCDEYLIDLNATRAYKVAYKKCKSDLTARTNGSKLLTNTNIQTYISEKQKEIEQRTEVTQDMVIKELSKIAFLDIRKLYNNEGGLKNIQDIDSDTAGAINSIESVEEFDGYGEDKEQIGYTKKIKLSEKTKALELLGRHLGLFNDKLDINVKEKEEKKNAISDILNQMKNVDDTE